MCKLPHFPLYPQDFLGSNRVELLSNEELGAYFRLICRAWTDAPAASLPDDDHVLAVYARCQPDRWPVLKPRVMPFFTLRNSRYWHERLKKEHETAMAKVRAGQASGESRRNKTRTEVEQTSEQPSGYGSGSSSPPSSTEFKTYCERFLLLPSEADDLLLQCEQRQWRDAADAPIRDWRKYVARRAPQIIEKRSQKPRKSLGYCP